MYSRNPDNNCDLSTTVWEDYQYQEAVDNDSVDSPTILGGVYNNPYSIATMTAAFNYIYTSSIPQIAPTHSYIRFKPTSISQLNILDSLDFELYDYPLNRQVIQDGDYWPDAYTDLSQNEYPWLYTVVEKNLVLPAGIQAEVLEDLHIPSDNEVLEDEAFYITKSNRDNDCALYKYFVKVKNADQHLYLFVLANNGNIDDYSRNYTYCFKVY